MATSTKLDIKVSVPENINDKYFARVKAEKSKKKDDIFEAKREAYKPSKLRKDMAPTTTYSSIPSKVTNNISSNLGKNCKGHLHESIQFVLTFQTNLWCHLSTNAISMSQFNLS